jgi:glycosyltransferase involved in cell wall biosynthesis
MSWSCVINNRNYGRFLPDAVHSALAQTLPFAQILIVDDGSTDDSPAVARRLAATHPSVHFIPKQHGGQLSCFNAAIPHVRGEFVSFLDADDCFEPHHNAVLAGYFHSHPGAQYLFHSFQIFGLQPRPAHQFPHSTILPAGPLNALLCGPVPRGGPTSTITLRKKLADRLLPSPNEPQYPICADEVLVEGAQYLGLERHYLRETLTRYRAHGNNSFHNIPRTASLRELDARRKLHLLGYYRKLLGFTGAPRLPDYLREFLAPSDIPEKRLALYLRPLADRGGLRLSPAREWLLHQAVSAAWMLRSQPPLEARLRILRRTRRKLRQLSPPRTVPSPQTALATPAP